MVERNDANIKVFNMITNRTEANANTIVQLSIQFKNRTVKHVNVSIRIIAHAKEI